MSLVSQLETLSTRIATEFNSVRSEMASSGSGASVYVGDAPPSSGDYSFWFKSDDGTLFYNYDDGDSVQWVEAKNPNNYTGDTAINAFSSRMDAVESNTTTQGTRLDKIRSGYYIRQAFTEVDTADRSSGSSWTLGPTFSSKTYKANSLIKFYYYVPVRNDYGGWGGIRIEPQVAINGTWYQLGNNGHDMMTNSNQDIFTYSNSMILDFAQTSDFTAQFRFYFKSYEGTAYWNQYHDLNGGSTGTAFHPSAGAQNRTYMHINVEELATGQ